MKLNSFLILSLFLLHIGCANNAPSTSSSPEFKTFTSDTMRFSIDYPASWEQKYIQDSTQAVGFYEPLSESADKFQENVQLWIEDLPMAISDTLYTQATIGQLKIVNPQLQVQTLPDISTSNTRFGRYNFEFTTHDSAKYSVEGYVCLHNLRGYNITFTSEKKNSNSYHKIVNQIIESFKIKP